jgi:ATP-dependent DNA helicase RecG
MLGITGAVGEELERALKAIEAGARPRAVESSTLDFKQDAGDLKRTLQTLAQAAVCFANASGGLVILGVQDEAEGPSAFLGTKVTPEEARKGIHERTNPQMLVNAFPLERQGAALLCVQISGDTRDVWADSAGRFTSRIGTDCVPMDDGAVRRLSEERHGMDRSAQPTDTSLSELSPMALTLAREQLRRLPDSGRSRLASLNDSDLLRALGVLTSDGRLLAAGRWLFCSPDPAETVDHLLYQYKATPGGEAHVVERLGQPLVVAFSRLMDLISARRSFTPVNLPDGQQLAIEDFPEAAVREAVANAVVHRDYRLTGPVVVVHSPDVFHVTSPGPLVPGVTLENILTTPSRPRNPLLARVFQRLGFAEELGVGVDRIYREMIRSGRDLPEFEAQFDHFRVVLTGGAPVRTLVRYVATLPDDVDVLLVLMLLTKNRTVSASGVAPMLQKTEAEAEQTLKTLASDQVGMLEPTRETYKSVSPKYRLRSEVIGVLGPAVRYRRRTQDDIDRKIIAHVREYGRVTNATVRNLLDLSTPRASAILKDLRDRQVLSKTSDATRGPSVEYGPGPKFPREAVSTPKQPADEPTLFDV